MVLGNLLPPVYSVSSTNREFRRSFARLPVVPVPLCRAAALRPGIQYFLKHEPYTIHIPILGESPSYCDMAAVRINTKTPTRASEAAYQCLLHLHDHDRSVHQIPKLLTDTFTRPALLCWLITS